MAPPGGFRLFVGYLPFRFDWKSVKDLFRDHGISVRHADIAEDPATGKSKGHAIVEVESQQDVDMAIERIQNMEVEGRRLLVREDREPPRASKGAGKDVAKGRGNDYDRSRWPRDERPARNQDWDDRHGRSDRPLHREESRPWKGQSSGKVVIGASGGVPGRIILEQLPPRFSWQGVKDLLRDAGFNAKQADIVEPGVAVAGLMDPSLAAVAVRALHGKNIDGYRIVVHEDGQSPPKAASSRPSGGTWKGGKEDQSYRRDQGKGRASSQALPSSALPSSAPKKRLPPESQEDIAMRRLFAENLAEGVDWKQLKDLFKGYFDVRFADVIAADEGDVFGIIEFNNRADALEACLQFNGVLLADQPVRLRQDRGEFEELRSAKKQRTEVPREGEQLVEDEDAGQDATLWEDEEPYIPPEEGEVFDDTIEDNGKRKPTSKGDKGGKGGGKSGNRVYVGNLDYSVSWQVLKDHMRKAGDVKFCDLNKYPDGRLKGSAFVEYATLEDCQTAIDKLNDSLVGARPIHVRMVT